jgi:hypothetical protein
MLIIHSFLETEILYSVWVTDVDSLRGSWLIVCLYLRTFKFFSTLQFLPHNIKQIEVGYNVMKGAEYFVSL